MDTTLKLIATIEQSGGKTETNGTPPIFTCSLDIKDTYYIKQQTRSEKGAVMALIAFLIERYELED